MNATETRETWRIHYVPFDLAWANSLRTLHTFDTMEEANDWIRVNGKELRHGLYRAEKD